MSAKFKQKKGFNKSHGPTSRKDLRKQMRKEKKAKKNEYFKKKNIKGVINENKKPGKPKFNYNLNTKCPPKIVEDHKKVENDPKDNKIPTKPQKSFIDLQNKLHKEEMREKSKLERGIRNQRKKMLMEANKEEDKEIKRLEKQLKLNKRKSKTVPKSFVDEGLDWLLEVCDTEKLRESDSLQANLQDSGSEFEDDFAIATGQGKRKLKIKEDSSKRQKKTPDSQGKSSNESDSDNKSQSEYSLNDDESEGNYDFEQEESDQNLSDIESDVNQDEEEGSANGSQDEGSENNESDSELQDESNSDDSKDEFETDEEENNCNEDEESDNNIKTNNSKRELENGKWEDIYGRLRDEKGNVLQVQEKQKYVPPQLRAKALGQDKKKVEELAQLKKQLKGLVNRLAESNLHSIANQIDELYMRNSRSDMNDSLLSLISEALIFHVLTPERLVIEHSALIAVLHANVGLEVGAHFLQSFVQRFDLLFNQGPEVEDKELDNILLIISHLYNFKVFHAVLMYNILDKLVERFEEKEVELILLVLRSVGFSLRKDDPLALKDVVLRLQRKANDSVKFKDNPRVKFMLDILLAVKNNNMAKIPQYDPSHSEHLKKLMKTMIHKGKYITELKITLEDLLKAEERGRWWIVGSAWTGVESTPTPNSATPASDSQYSQTVLDLARKQRMNTDTRRNIFCILVTAEDYLDAFEKLLRLGLKAQQEQEIVHVMVHCLMQEKTYNPYYSHLASQLCKADRKHQMTIQYHVWDKLKELSKLSQSKIVNLAKFLAHLFLEKALPISVLKVMQFSEMDKCHVRLLRQVLLSVLLSDLPETVSAVFSRVSRPEKLHMFRESLRLFLHHFVLRNVSDLPTDQATLLKDRVKLAETALIHNDAKAKFL
ncbi:nucleolar MIF4G domain-containing protein 1 [Macrosteles quadrilineatus]|uniref:nucleolar MIF4G domain-containing protein 1 n=1 Tax=Macrosteles quadrilineatus TaxID=74068 RepID=UPI0023E08F6C|nr:nucleolar MIF4G domain-containing protein 1 [Macrosteles quadrilineatus]